MFKSIFGNTVTEPSITFTVLRDSKELYNSTTYKSDNKVKPITNDNIQTIFQEIILSMIIFDAYNNTSGKQEYTKAEGFGIARYIILTYSYEKILTYMINHNYTIKLNGLKETSQTIPFNIDITDTAINKLTIDEIRNDKVIQRLVKKDKSDIGTREEDIEKLNNPEYYAFKSMYPEQQDDLNEVTGIPLQVDTTGGSKPTQSLQKTNLRVQINNQTRVVYLNKYKTQYVKYNNEYMPLSKAKKLEKSKH